MSLIRGLPPPYTLTAVFIRSLHFLPTLLKRWWPWWLLLPGCLASWTKFIEQYDSMRIGRCIAICGENYSDSCMKTCLESKYTKSGHCPEKRNMTIFEAACLRACEEDFECPSLAKCCENDCGINCMHPTGLEKWAGLPAIPSNVRIRQRRTNLIILSWNKPGHPIDDFFGRNRISYVIEERYVLGPVYLEHRLTSWALRNVSIKSHATLDGGFKRGHWYQFRVAAINEHGSRGYSQPSRPLMTKGPRKPREPRNLTLTGARVVNGKLRVQLRWRQPFSDAPIQSYKIYWSRLIRGFTNTTVLVHHRTVPQEKICHEVKGLDLDSQYFLQVQAIAVYGSRRLTSPKSSRIFNSTDYMKFAEVGNLNSRMCERHQEGLRVRKMKCLCGEIEANLAWTPVKAASHYNITWGELSCKRTIQAPGIFHYRPRIVSEITKGTHYAIQNLRPGCTYNISIRSVFEMERGQEHAASIEFFASGCYQRQRNGKLQNRVQGTQSRCKIKSPNIRRYYSES